MKNDEDIIYQGNTTLESYQVIDMHYEGRKARVLFTKNREAAFSGIPLDGEHELLFDYIQRLYEMTAYLRPKRLLLIGGGVYTLPMALLNSLPDIQIDAVEIDSGLDSIAEMYFGFTENPRLNIIHADGKQFLSQTSTTYDMIIIDAFTNLQIPASLEDGSTAKLVHSHLTKNGSFAMNIISSYYGRRSQTIRRYKDTYSAMFDSVNVYPADTSMSLWLPQNLVLVAKKGRMLESSGMRFGPLNPIY